MNSRALLPILLAATVASPAALAGPPPGKGKERAEAQSAAAVSRAQAKEEAAVLDSCRPRVAFILRGDLVSTTPGTDGTTAVTILVKGGNAHTRRYAGQQVTLTVGEQTRVVRRGRADAADLVVGDRLLVHVRACKAGEATAAATAVLYAKHVVAKPAVTEAEDGEEATESP